MPDPVVTKPAAAAATLTIIAGVLEQYAAYIAPAIFGAGGALCALAFVAMDPPLSVSQKVWHIMGSAFVAAAGTGWLMRLSGWDGPDSQAVIAIVLGIGAPVIVRTIWDSIGGWLSVWASKRGK